MDKQKILNIALIVTLGLLLMQMFTRQPATTDVTVKDDLEIGIKNELTIGTAVNLTLKNNTEAVMTFANTCPKNPFTVSEYQNGEWKTLSAQAQNCPAGDTVIQPGESKVITYQHFQKDLFSEIGKYRIEIPVSNKTFLKDFEIVNPNIFGKVWRILIYQPVYNALIFLTQISGNSFGWGIVLLTLALRLILFIPFQKSLASQRRLQKIQPEIDAIKKRFAGNQQMIAMETVAIMKKNNVSMFGSCLPILIQMPFLIALFWAARDGLGENSLIYLYSFIHDFNPALIATNFFGLDLVAFGNQLYFALPIFLAISQFFQMKLALSKTKKKTPEEKKDSTNENAMAEAMQSMNKFMPYFLPLMIAFFSATMPAAVGIYWGTSTLFGILQQLIVNRQVK
ncbi:MAG: YidC/Oxa1 family membrane protein insertase [Candidatus Gracilibacteria bacterium]|jgi:YidC/Oxa1 family membrane protein insertase